MKPINPIPTVDQLEFLYSQIGRVYRNGEKLVVDTSQVALEFRSRILAWDWWKNHPYQIAQLVQPVEEINKILAEFQHTYRDLQGKEEQLEKRVAA